MPQIVDKLFIISQQFYEFTGVSASRDVMLCWAVVIRRLDRVRIGYYVVGRMWASDLESSAGKPPRHLHMVSH